MNYKLAIIFSFVFFSCKNKLNNKTENCNNVNDQDKSIENKPEYPLVRFYYDGKDVKNEKHELYYPKDVTDLIVDTTDGYLTISFDIEIDTTNSIYGQIDRHLNWNDKLNNDTIYLDYYQNHQRIEDANPTKTKIRLYYQITDALSYKNALYIPRQLRH